MGKFGVGGFGVVEAQDNGMAGVDFEVVFGVGGFLVEGFHEAAHVGGHGFAGVHDDGGAVEQALGGFDLVNLLAEVFF